MLWADFAERKSSINSIDVICKPRCFSCLALPDGINFADKFIYVERERSPPAVAVRAPRDRRGRLSTPDFIVRIIPAATKHGVSTWCGRLRHCVDAIEQPVQLIYLQLAGIVICTGFGIAMLGFQTLSRGQKPLRAY